MCFKTPGSEFLKSYLYTWYKSFFLFLYKVSDSYKGRRKQKRTRVVCYVRKGPILHYYTHLISYSEYSVAFEELSFHFALLSPCRTEKFFLRNKTV